MSQGVQLSTRNVIYLYRWMFEFQEENEELYGVFLKLQGHIFEKLTLEEIQNLKTDYEKTARRFP